MKKENMRSEGAVLRSSAQKRLRLISVAAVLLICCLAFVGAVGAETCAGGDTCTHNASVGSEHYASIQEAVERAVDGDVIKVIADHEVNCNVVQSVPNGDYTALILVNGKDITIDLNGCTVTADYSNGGTSINAVIWVHTGAKLTLTDSSESEMGMLYFKTNDNNKLGNMLLNYNSEEAGGHSMVIKGGTYMTNLGASGGCIVYSQGDETTLVTGGTFKIDNVGTLSNGSPWIFNAKGQNTRNIIVEGGTFNADIVHQYYLFEVIVPKEKALVENSNGIWTMVDAVAYVNEEAYSGGWWSKNVGYATVEDAVSKLGEHNAKVYGGKISGRSITLIKDAVLEDTLEFTKSTVFNMGGKKIIWKGDDNENIFDVTGDENILTIDSFNIIREGYTIAMWNKDGEEFENPSENDGNSVSLNSFLSMSTANPPEPNEYTVTFDTDGGSAVEAITQNYGTYVTAPATNPTKEGYTFAGWDEEIPATMPAESITITAQWTINQYTIAFNTNGGSTVESITQDYNTAVTAPAEPTKEGYIFKGWDKEIPSTMPAEDMTITALWDRISTSSGGSSSGSYFSFPRTTTNGGLVDFGSSKVVKALMLPEGSSGSVLLKVDTVEKWPKALETEYTFDISVEKLGEGVSYIHFEIPEAKLTALELTAADIGAYHYEGEVWTKLPTTYEVKDGVVCYEAETDSFSPFKLVIEKGAAVPKEEEIVPTVPPVEEPEDTPVDKPEDVLQPIEPIEPTEPTSPAPLFAVLAGLGAAVLLRRR